MRNAYTGGEFVARPGSLCTCDELGVMIDKQITGPGGSEKCKGPMILAQNVNERSRCAKGQPFVACLTHLTVSGQR